MRISIAKGEQADSVRLVRCDGSEAHFTFPKKGPWPHDAFHFFVERGLGLNRGFWGLVAAGMDPGEVGALAAAGGHASAKRARDPEPQIVELLQAERLVECFEAESWSAGSDNASIQAMAEAGWAASLVPPLEISDDAIDAVRSGIHDFCDRWDTLEIGGSVALEWEDNNG